MIHWLVQSASDHPDLERGIAPEGLLHPVEQSRLAELKSDKRRYDWLLGRWTAKHLIQYYIEQWIGIRPLLDTITILNSSDGAPYVSLSAGWSRHGSKGGPYRELWTRRPTLHLSISHREDQAFCALCDIPGVQIGADIERIEPRPSQFVTDYFTSSEIDQVDNAPPELHDALVTAIWSAKEAALKALRLGLTVDTRWVSCQITATDIQNWTNFDLHYASSPLHARAVATATSTFDHEGSRVAASHMLIGWWRIIGSYVLTIVVKRET